MPKKPPKETLGGNVSYLLIIAAAIVALGMLMVVAYTETHKTNCTEVCEVTK